jgi:hypothetical protein
MSVSEKYYYMYYSVVYTSSLEIIKIIKLHKVVELFCTYTGELPAEINGKLKILVQESFMVFISVG